MGLDRPPDELIWIKGITKQDPYAFLSNTALGAIRPRPKRKSRVLPVLRGSTRVIFQLMTVPFLMTH
jgi:hypothetical protein